MTSNKKGYIKASIQLPENVAAYLKENCTRLLNGNPQLVLDTFSKLMGYPEDMVYDQIEVEALHAILTKFEEEKNGPRMGIQGLIYGGKYEGKVPQLDQLPDIEGVDDSIKGVVAGIRLFTDVPDEEATITLKDADDNLYNIRVLSDFLLDAEHTMVGEVLEEQAVSFFTVEFTEDGRAEVTPITDDSRFLLVDSVWSILEQYLEEEYDDKPHLYS